MPLLNNRLAPIFIISKNLIFGGILYFLITPLLAQSPMSVHGGLEVQLNTKGAFLKPEIILGKNSWELHPGILMGKRYLNSSLGGGLGISALYFPAKCEGPISFYFLGDMQRYKFYYESQGYEYRFHLLQGTLGYGFRIKVKDRLSIYQSLSLGGLLQKQKINFNGPAPAWSLRGAGVINVGVSL